MWFSIDLDEISGILILLVLSHLAILIVTRSIEWNILALFEIWDVVKLINHALLLDLDHMLIILLRRSMFEFNVHSRIVEVWVINTQLLDYCLLIAVLLLAVAMVLVFLLLELFLAWVSLTLKVWVIVSVVWLALVVLIAVVLLLIIWIP